MTNIEELRKYMTAENKNEDVQVIDVETLDEEYAVNFDKPWLVQFADAEVIEADTEEEACEIQRLWRDLSGCDY
jgi:TPP-dependent trihydroxycyclohexane-1,2-dione (THcHDO) dehydratase